MRDEVTWRGASRTAGSVNVDLDKDARIFAKDVSYSPEDIGRGSTHLLLNTSYPGLKRIHQWPPVYLVEHFLSAEECVALVKRAEPLLRRSLVVTPSGFQPAASRTSTSCNLDKSSCAALLQKVRALTRKPHEHMESPQVARYTSSQQYQAHYDSVDPHTEEGRSFCADGGQRVATVLVYLNDVASGGCTQFPRLGLTVTPARGTALVFFPAFLNGEVDPDALHCGMPAVDTKWVSQVWIRQSERTGR